ncbi:hypothetical protein F7X37_00405 [Candidatus Ecksteinia adelgidicola]|nr:hypothetical protein F7X37_00405 [Candidatus Ecksteinia adelgidicola]
MSNNRESTIGKAADIHICIKMPKEVYPLGLASTTSTTAMLVMGDTLAISLLKSRNFTLKIFHGYIQVEYLVDYYYKYATLCVVVMQYHTSMHKSHYARCTARND